jgi:SAM-dependent methyltransferase
MKATTWSDDDAYWIASYPFFFSESRFAEAIADIPKLTRLSGRTAGTVLDLCCGPGRYSIPFAKSGFAVTAVDRTRFLLEKAKAYGAAERVNIEWVQDDMRHFVRPNAFRLAISMFTSFGYFDDIDENRSVLQNIHTSLEENGVLLMDVMGKEILARTFQSTGSFSLPNGDLFVDRREIIDDWSRIRTQYIAITNGQTQSFRVTLWLFSARELKELLSTAGFSSVTIYGDLDGAAYGPNAKRLVAVATK